MNAAPLTAAQSSLPVMTWPHWRLVFLLMGICALSHFNRISMTVAADLRIMDRYGLSTTAMGAVYSAFLVSYTLLMIPCGWLIDRRGPAFALAVVCFGSAAFIVCTAGVGLASSAAVAFAALLVIRSLMGVLSSPVHPGAAKALSIEIPLSHRSATNGMVTGAAVFGVASTYIVFGTLVDWFDWPVAFLIAAAVTAGLGGLWMCYAPASLTHAISREPVHDAPPSEWFGGREIVNLALLTISYAAVGYFQYLFFYWMHYYFESVLELGPEKSRFYAGIPPLAMALGMPLGGWLSDRIQSRFGWKAARSGMISVAMLASAALLWIGVRATDPLSIVVWLSLSLGALGMAEGPLWVTAVEVGGRRGGLSSAIFNCGGNAGGIVAPIVTPWVSDSLGYGWQSGISLGSLVCVAGAICWLWIQPPASRRREVESTTGPSERPQ